VNPLLTAYLDALDAWKRDPSTHTASACMESQLAWFAHVNANADSAAILLALLADPATGGPHISPDAPPEVWGAWRELTGVDNG